MIYDLHTLHHQVSVSADTASFALGLPKQDIEECIQFWGFAAWHGNADEMIVCVPTGYDLPDSAAAMLLPKRFT